MGVITAGDRKELLRALAGESELLQASSSYDCFAFGEKSSTNEEMMEDDKSDVVLIENTKYKTPTYETVVCPNEIDPVFFAGLTPELQSEIVQNQQQHHRQIYLQEKKNRKREAKKLHDHLSSGLNDLAPNNPCMAKNNKDDSTFRKRGRPNEGEVLVQSWFDGCISDESRAHVIGDRPIHYHVDSTIRSEPVPNDLVDIKTELQKKILALTGDSENALVTKQTKAASIVSCETLEHGYYRGHLSDTLSRRLSEYLPGPFQVKRSADKKGIVFFSPVNTQCCTHFDRDSSILYLLSGYKEVLIARPRTNASGVWTRAEE